MTINGLLSIIIHQFYQYNQHRFKDKNMIIQNIQRIHFSIVSMFLVLYSSNIVSMQRKDLLSAKSVVLSKFNSVSFPENTFTSGISPDGTKCAITTDKGCFLYDS